MPRHNGSILTIDEIIKFFMSSATKAKLAAMFITAKKIPPLCQTLIGMRWTQPPSPLKTDNYTAAGVTNNTIFPHQNKSMDMQFYWLRCHSAQEQFHFYCTPRGINWSN